MQNLIGRLDLSQSPARTADELEPTLGLRTDFSAVFAPPIHHDVTGLKKHLSSKKSQPGFIMCLGIRKKNPRAVPEHARQERVVNGLRF